MGKVNLKMLVDEAKADSAMVFDTEGHILDSYNLPNENNVSAMAAVIMTMSEEFFQDALDSTDFKQLVLKAKHGMVVMNRFSEEHVICLIAKDLANAAIMKLTLQRSVS